VGKRILKEEGDKPLTPSSASVVVCVRGGVDLHFSVIIITCGSG